MVCNVYYGSLTYTAQFAQLTNANVAFAPYVAFQNEWDVFGPFDVTANVST